MSEETSSRAALFNQTLERFSKLNAAGRHCFIGRLIDGVEGKPVLMQEIGHVLQRLETDSNLAICWESADAAAQGMSPAGELAA